MPNDATHSKDFAPICIWCNAEWSDDNVKILDVSASGGCDTCGYGAAVSGSISIVCHKCNREMYRKEFND